MRGETSLHIVTMYTGRCGNMFESYVLQAARTMASIRPHALFVCIRFDDILSPAVQFMDGTKVVSIIPGTSIDVDGRRWEVK